MTPLTPEKTQRIDELALKVKEQSIELHPEQILTMLKEITAKMIQIECDIAPETSSDSTGGEWTTVRVYLKDESDALFVLRIARKLSVRQTMLPLGSISALTAEEYLNLIETNLERRLSASVSEKEALMTRIESVLTEQKRFNPKTGVELSYDGLRSIFEKPFSFSRLTGRPMDEKITGCTIISNSETEESLHVPYDEAQVLLNIPSTPWSVTIG